MAHDTENCPGGADCPERCPPKQFTLADWDMIQTALYMAAHEYLATYRDCRGLGPEAERCAAMRNRISKLLPRVERARQVKQGEELVLRHGAAIKWIDGEPQL